MTEHVQVPMRESLRGVRLHRLRAGNTPPPRILELLQLRESAQQIEARRAALLLCAERIGSALSGLPDLVRANVADVVAMATELGLAVAREVVGDAVEHGLVDPAPVVRRCLEGAVRGLTDQSLTIHLHPEDLSPVVAELQRDPALLGGVAGAQFAPAPELARGAVRVDTSAGRLIYDHGEVLARISEQVRAAAAETHG